MWADPDALKMTVIKGSKFVSTTRLKNGYTYSTTGKVKVRVNKKTLIPKITCKGSGSATLTLENDKQYTVYFTVEKPKAQKSEKKMTTFPGTVTKTLKDLFGTSIDAGKLTIRKQKHGQATLSGNKLIVKPVYSDRIKLRYKYLNKTYNMTIKVK